MKINGETMIRASCDDFYWNESRDIIVEKHLDKWRGYHTTDKYGEHAEVWVEGSFRSVVNQLREYFKESS